jgi:hypothetical protein
MGEHERVLSHWQAVSMLASSEYVASHQRQIGLNSCTGVSVCLQTGLTVHLLDHAVLLPDLANGDVCVGGVCSELGVNSCSVDAAIRAWIWVWLLRDLCILRQML